MNTIKHSTYVLNKIVLMLSLHDLVDHSAPDDVDGRCPWGEESLLREDTDEGLWFFGPAGDNNYRVAGVSLLSNIVILN